jgi:uncharacterized protein
MAPRTDIFDLGGLDLRPGEARSIDLTVNVDGVTFGGQDYVLDPSDVDVRIDVSRMNGGGLALRLRAASELSGPCMRCLDDAHQEISVDAREVDQPGGGEELTSPYLTSNDLDVAAWTRDAFVLALPLQVLCRQDCLGLCPVCGEDLNQAGPDHAHESQPDQRWAKLNELKFE